MHNGESADVPLDFVMSYADLRAGGATRAGIREALAAGTLHRARRDVYVAGGVGEAVIAAQRVGGRLDCVSAVEAAGIFVLHRTSLHVQVEPSHSRLRSPESRRRRLAEGSNVAVHWRSSAHGAAHSIPLLEALAVAIRCQGVRASIAMLDNALYLRRIDDADVRTLFAGLPAKYAALQSLIDGRAETGSESMARLLLRNLGCSVQIQVQIEGVGRVDLLVDGWIVVECDSRAHHGGWEAQERDRLRDLRLAARGYVVIRPTANMIFTDPDSLRRAVQGLRASALGR